MEKIRYYAALMAAKTLIGLIKLRGKSKGTSAPGLLAMKICPNFIKYAVQNNKEKIIFDIVWIMYRCNFNIYV